MIKFYLLSSCTLLSIRISENKIYIYSIQINYLKIVFLIKFFTLWGHYLLTSFGNICTLNTGCRVLMGLQVAGYCVELFLLWLLSNSATGRVAFHTHGCSPSSRGINSWIRPSGDFHDTYGEVQSIPLYCW